jgi:hypothetical protein
MKKIFALSIILLAFASCQKENAVTVPEDDVAFVTINNFTTKSQIGTDAVLKWSKGDKLAVFGDADYTASEFLFRSGEGYSTAAFGGQKPQGEEFIVCHPSTTRCDGITLRGIIDTKVSHKMPLQTLGSLPMWGKTKDLSKVSLNGVCGILKLDIKGSVKLQSILLNAGRPISGEFLCTIEDGLFAMIGGANIVYMETDGTEVVPSEATSFYFVLPPGEYEAMKVNLTDTEGEVSYLTLEDSFVIEAGVFTSVSLNL